MNILKRLWDKYRTFIVYMVFGLMATLLETFLYWLFYEVIGLRNMVSTVIAIIITITFAFFTNKLYVFQSKHLDMKTMTKEFSAFVGSRIFTGIIAWILFPILLYLGIDRFIIETPGMLAKIITSVVEIVLNWVLSKYFVFRKKPEQTE